MLSLLVTFLPFMSPLTRLLFCLSHLDTGTVECIGVNIGTKIGGTTVHESGTVTWVGERRDAQTLIIHDALYC